MHLSQPLTVCVLRVFLTGFYFCALLLFVLYVRPYKNLCTICIFNSLSTFLEFFYQFINALCVSLSVCALGVSHQSAPFIQFLFVRYVRNK